MNISFFHFCPLLEKLYKIFTSTIIFIYLILGFIWSSVWNKASYLPVPSLQAQPYTKVSLILISHMSHSCFHFAILFALVADGPAKMLARDLSTCHLVKYSFCLNKTTYSIIFNLLIIFEQRNWKKWDVCCRYWQRLGALESIKNVFVWLTHVVWSTLGAFYLTFILQWMHQRQTWGSYLVQGYLASRLERSRIEPPTID